MAWTAGAKWVTQLASWASLIYVARTLSQADYGIGEMAGYFFAITNTMAEFGVGTSVLHMTELDDSKVHQLHGFSLLLCCAIYVASLLLSPLIADFFHQPGLVAVIAVTNLSFLITGLQAVPTGLLQRDMDYRRLSIAEACLYIVQSVVTAAAAGAGWGYWALVSGVLVGKTANAVIVLLWKPIGFSFPKWRDIREPLAFGRQAAVSNLAVTVYGHSDVVVVGRMLGDSALGTYRMALYLASAPAEKISTLIMRTAGPLFANLQSDQVLARRYFLLLAETLNLVVVPAMTGLAIVAPEAVTVILGAKWASAAGPLIWLAVYMVFSTMSSLIAQVLISRRETQLMMRISLVNLVIMPVAFTIGAHWNGTTGAAAAWVLATPLTLLPAAILLLRRLRIKWRDYGATLIPTIVSAGAMAILLGTFRSYVTGTALSPAFRLASEIAVGAVVYAAMSLIFFRARMQRYVEFVRRLRSGH
ncbi:MAG: lipopolysaccharide biosynthesis protein [Bryobacterales bacterium]|nr:lipopolysaccharide biosynthesis protein [Bryobacterales bacterium]